MNHIIKICLVSLVCVLFSITALPVAAAASPATIQVKAEVFDSNFWDFTFIKESIPSKATSIKAEWSLGNTGKNPKTSTIILAGKTSGQIDISSEKGELVNLNVCVINAKNEVLGKWSMQITNKGQTETITIALPERTEPLLTRTTI